MITLNEVEIIEGITDTNEVGYYRAIQSAINGGTAWSLQGSYGRSMMDAIENGDCLLGRESCNDYWGSEIPSRYDVKPGSIGSFEYVAKTRGEIWANMMESV